MALLLGIGCELIGNSLWDDGVGTYVLTVFRKRDDKPLSVSSLLSSLCPKATNFQ